MNAKEVQPGSLNKEDIIVAFMGPTGTGKSTFIDIATNQKRTTAGHSLDSCTTKIRAVRCYPTLREPYVLVDTPGFNDTDKSDIEILRLIADWLAKTYKNDVKLAGIIYLHRISDNRMAGSPLKNLHMFNNLCGDGAITHVVLATTMWNRVKEAQGDTREEELRANYWRAMIQMGSRTMRFNGSEQSAWDIIRSATGERGEGVEPMPLLLQEELVDLKRRLSETAAGKMLYTTLQKLLVDQKEALRKLHDQAKAENNDQLAEELRVQYEELEASLQHTFNQLSEMKIPLTRRIRMIFSFKKPRSNVVAID